MSESKFYVKPLAPSVAIQKFVEVAKEVSPGQSVTSFSINTPLGTVTLIEGRIPLGDLPNQSAFAGKASLFVGRDFVDLNSISLQVADGWNLSYLDQPNEDPHLRLVVNPDDLQKTIRGADAIGKAFDVVRRSEFGSTRLPKDQLEALKFAERTIGSFASEAAKLSQSTVTQFQEFTRLIREKSLELDEQYRIKEQQLQAKYEQKSSELESKEKAHAENVKQFELRNNTVVRRDLLREIRNKIESQKSVQISPETSQKRRIIHVFSVATFVLSAALIATFAFKLAAAAQFDWHYLLPLTAGTVIFVSTGIFYINWNDQWFRDHARVEFENRKFSADILRASWIAELFFEWEQKKETSMPPQLLASFTKNLFDSQYGDARPHPFDQLTELVKQVSTFKIDKSGVEILKQESKR